MLVVLSLLGVLPFPGPSVAAWVAVPIVTAPETLPAPPKTPPFTATAPLPVAEPVHHDAQTSLKNKFVFHAHVRY